MSLLAKNFLKILILLTNIMAFILFEDAGDEDVGDLSRQVFMN